MRSEVEEEIIYSTGVKARCRIHETWSTQNSMEENGEGRKDRSPSYEPAKSIKRNPSNPVSPKVILRSSHDSLTCLIVWTLQKGVMFNTN